MPIITAIAAAVIARTTPAAAFIAGFDYVLADFAAGMHVEASVDLATTPADRRPQAFCDGARAAANAVLGWTGEVHRVGRAYGVPAGELDWALARARASVVRSLLTV